MSEKKDETKQSGFKPRRKVKKPRIVHIPEHRKLLEKEYVELQEHARRSAMHYLSKSQKSEQTIRDKLLAKGYVADDVLIVPNPDIEIGGEEISEEALSTYVNNTEADDKQNIIDNVIASLQEYDFVNDKAMAQNIIRSERLKGKGDNSAKQKMFEKGLSADIIDSVFDDSSDADSDDYNDFSFSVETSAREALDRAARSYMMKSAYQNEESEYKRRGKMYRFLSNRGFSSSEINDFLENGFLEED